MLRRRALLVAFLATLVVTALALPGCGGSSASVGADAVITPVPIPGPQAKPTVGARADSTRMSRAQRSDLPEMSGASAGAARRQGGSESSGDALSKADVLENGIALPPFEAPEQVRQIIEAGNEIARRPYLWGGGHGRWLDTGYDCSGSISFALANAGLMTGPLDSGRLMTWGEPGKGKWVTLYTNPGHVFMVVAGVRFDTSGTKTTGSRWQSGLRPTDDYVVRHPPGL